MSEADCSAVLALTVRIVSAHIGHNSVHTDALPALINSVYAALSRVGATPAGAPGRPEPAVPIKKSVFPDYIVCLEDGLKLKMLKRHLAASFNMTPDQYRARWGLPPEYPMVAPRYAAQRSATAKRIGLGTLENQPGKRGGRPKKR